MRIVFAFSLILILTASRLWAGTVEDGIKAYDNKDYKQAMSLLSPLADQGNTEALSTVGLMYYYGHGVQEDNLTAFKFFKQAADKGYADAQFLLGNMYMYHYGDPQADTDSDREAVRWYVEAATQGHAEAQYTLGLLLLAGSIVAQDTNEAMVWIKRAADQGHKEAKQFLGEYSE